MTLAQLRPSKNLSIWFLGLLMVLIPLNYWCEAQYGLFMLRISQEQLFQVVGIVIFAIFILNNIYLSLFLLWSTFLYGYYCFPNPSGQVLFSLFIGCVFYEVAYRLIDEKNINLLFKFMIWFAIANIIYIVMQKCGLELIYKDFALNEYAHDAVGFFGIKCMMGMFFAMVMPFAAYRYPKLSALLFIPIAVSESSCAMAAAIVAYLWQLWFLSKKWFTVALVLLTVGGSAYVIHDTHAGMFENRVSLWKMAMRDAVQRPIFGYGLDSFRCISDDKQFMYWSNCRTKEAIKIDVRDSIEYKHTQKFNLAKYGKWLKEGDTIDPWDNPHNEFVMLFYEWGVLPFVILGFLVYAIVQRFTAYQKVLVPLVGFLIGVAVMSIGQFPFHTARNGIYIPIFLAALFKITDMRKAAIGPT